VIYRIETSLDLVVWSSDNLAQEVVATNSGVQIREVHYTWPPAATLFFPWRWSVDRP
jgi:hypothetical protein